MAVEGKRHRSTPCNALSPLHTFSNITWRRGGYPLYHVCGMCVKRMGLGIHATMLNKIIDKAAPKYINYLRNVVSISANCGFIINLSVP